MQLKSLLKYVEQLIFSGLSFGSVFFLAVALETEEFFTFSQLFTYLQGALLICFSYVSNPFLVFYSKKTSAYRLTSALTLSLIFSSCVLAVLIGYLYFVKEFSITLLLPLLLLSSWVTFDVYRKQMFVAADFKRLLTVSLFIAFSYFIAMLIGFFSETLTAQLSFLLLAAALVLGCCILTWYRCKQGGFTQKFNLGYFLANHNYAKWSVVSAFSAWFLTSGLLLLAEASITSEQFNAVRILLSFIGLSFLITNVFENQLIVTFNQLERLNVNMLFKQVIKVAKIALLISIVLFAVCYLSFEILYQSYASFFLSIAPLILLTWLQAIAKPLVAFLKVQGGIRYVFYSYLITSACTLLFYSQIFATAKLLGLVYTFLIGGALLVCWLVFFVYRISKGGP